MKVVFYNVLIAAVIGVIVLMYLARATEYEIHDRGRRAEHELRVKACQALQGRLMVSMLRIEAGPRTVELHRADITSALVEAVAYAPACVKVPPAAAAAVVGGLDRGGASVDVLAAGARALDRELASAAQAGWPTGGR